jgi:hypothetical protein
LGKRGGGALLLKSILEEMPSTSLRNWAIIKSSHNTSSGTGSLSSFEIVTPKDLLSSVSYIASTIKLLKVLLKESTRESEFVFIQNSPWDFPLLFFCRIRQMKITVAIHDWKKHSGDIWPPRLVTLLLAYISRDHIVFSDYAQKELELKGKIIKLNLPSFRAAERSSNGCLGNQVTFLCIGRIRLYKGIDTFCKAASISENQNFQFRIAGEGKIKFSVPQNVHVRNEWLEDEDFLSEIKNADVIVLPYSEASQSGIIPIAIQLQKMLIISDCPSLIEQIESYEYHQYLVHKFGNFRELCRLFELSAQMKDRQTSETHSAGKYIETLFWNHFQ